MAKEVLRGVTEIYGEKIGPNEHIRYDADTNELVFKLQTGPIKEVGVNGTQIDSMAKVLKFITECFDERYPSGYNKFAIEGLNQCLDSFAARKNERENRGVEGYNKK